jgi:Ulp1 family protease
MPIQENGFDCGVFVSEYAKRFFDTWPSSTAKDITEKYSEYFNARLFTQQDITAVRHGFREELER